MIKTWKKIPEWGILFIAAVLALFPMAWMLISSFKVEDEIYLESPTWIPKVFTFQNYIDLFARFNFEQLTLNSLVIATAVVVISVVLGTMASYGFSRYAFPGSSWLLGGLLLVRMITPSSLVVPMYIIMDRLDLLNNLTSIIIGITVLNLPFVVWIMKPFFDSVPKDIEEAAQLDGLSSVSVFWRIALPLATPGLFTVLLFSFIGGWVDLLFGITFSTSPEAMPLTAGLMQMQTGYEIYWGPLMAGGIYLSLPTFILAFVLQKYLITGLRGGF